MKYRADIDGLRAIAVLAVVQFHLSIPWLASGGYVGVDVFFVISGFLITSIIVEAIDAGKYSIADFYERRIRRIFPALFAVYAFILLMSLLIMYPAETGRIGQTILSSEYFVSNIFFSHSAGYFDVLTKNNPALHTWSLSVEEQFYVFFPLFMFAIVALGRKWRKPLIAVALVGLFVLSAYWVNISQNQAFYLVQFRAWELLVGSALAVGLVPPTKNQNLAEAIGIAGLGAILYAVFFYDEATLFPGASAVLPCLGSAAIIYAGGSKQGFASKLLSLEPMRRIGQISYSMYLWHWPIIVFYAYVFPFRNVEKIGLAVVILIVSWLSWRFIEQPFRHTSNTRSTLPTFKWAAVAMASLTLFAANAENIARAFNPVSQQSEKLIAELSADHYSAMRLGKCFLDSSQTIASFKVEECLHLDANKQNVLLIGDSHAAHLYPGFHHVFPSVNIMQATASGCKPMEHSKGAKRCLALLDFVENNFLPQNRVNTIVLSSQWAESDIENAVALASRLKAYADHVVISGPINEFRQNLPRIVANSVEAHVTPDDYAKTYLYTEQASTDAHFATLKLPFGVTYVSPYKALCTPVCRTLIDASTPMQFDSEHLTEKGSDFIAKQIGPSVLHPPS